MPELPDILAYLKALEPRVVGKTLIGIRVANPFLLRTVSPSPAEFASKKVVRLRRLGKRIVLELEEGLFIVIHLMIAGRLRWREPNARLGGKMMLAAFDFENGTLVLTEAATKKRAALYLVRGEEGLSDHSRGGLEVLDADLTQFKQALTRENHTLKRSLTDPRLFSGIGNAYSDEILHRARLSPFKQTTHLSEEEIAALFNATRTVLCEWIERLVQETGEGFPEKVTAFRPDMAVHGRYQQPCPVCGAPVQRIVYAENEANYCATCQTGGKLLADRGLSRLLKTDWPRTLGELEEMKQERKR
jgi:formamidopyrimidine-DNA glycosylase